jgi:cohesin loading factor subunit SCC2
MNSLEDAKAGAEGNASKGVALDHLGDIAARLKALQLEMERNEIVPSLDEVGRYVGYR